MSRYVDADAFYEDMCKRTDNDSWKDCWAEFVAILSSQPTADVVEVTRCRDCMHTEIDKYAPAECQNRCKLSQLYHEPTFFCKCGEPRMDLLEWIHRGDDDEQGV